MMASLSRCVLDHNDDRPYRTWYRKYEALSSSGAQASRPLSRAPSGTYTKLIDPKLTGNATTTTLSSSSKPPTIQPPSNIRPFRSQGTATPRLQSQETTPRALGHMRTGSKVSDMVSELSIANSNPPSTQSGSIPHPTAYARRTYSRTC
ncbi:hypothetical protein BS47DRAFT_724767 [Hydnum rufescens UP504]|uniref:Uncharacterized protein n=1 Tax=Hydnum rufescens UP504 TaxID=1448309 RepID=A0A9P6B1S9_9AGAM|nr:hypothetical protein BS47DRAFT_724767 [Hydnum rufescens UP504]